MPYFYEVYEALKKIMANEDKKLTPQLISDYLEERGKLVIARATVIFEESKTDPVTNNYTKF